jgi:uncharacterized protein (DUF486 family)
MLDRFYPALLLLGSNLFMTFAWYGHLRYKSAPWRWPSSPVGVSPCSSTA